MNLFIDFYEPYMYGLFDEIYVYISSQIYNRTHEKQNNKKK